MLRWASRNWENTCRHLGPTRLSHPDLLPRGRQGRTFLRRESSPNPLGPSSALRSDQLKVWVTFVNPNS
jgi:hypothetical protein